MYIVENNIKYKSKCNFKNFREFDGIYLDNSWTNINKILLL